MKAKTQQLLASATGNTEGTNELESLDWETVDRDFKFFEQYAVNAWRIGGMES